MQKNQDSILIVDDENSIRKLLHQKFSNEGFYCEEASNADQALEKLKNTIFSLVVLDIRMPGMLGTELLPQIIAGYPDTAVIMITANTDINVAIQCMRKGAYDYIIKPFDIEDVVLRVDRALEKNRLEHQVKDYQQHLEAKVTEQAEKIKASFIDAIKALVHALEAKDKYTSGHSSRVADISEIIAKAMGLSRESVEKIRLAALVHDIGKIGVREMILNKPDQLNEEELRQIKKHPEIGAHILKPIVQDIEILQIVQYHHKWFDGSGYPEENHDSEVPLGARIVSVADAYEAMISERPYRKALSVEAACHEIELKKGTQFDPEVVDIFLQNRNQMNF